MPNKTIGDIFGLQSSIEDTNLPDKEFVENIQSSTSTDYIEEIFGVPPVAPAPEEIPAKPISFNMVNSPPVPDDSISQIFSLPNNPADAIAGGQVVRSATEPPQTAQEAPQSTLPEGAIPFDPNRQWKPEDVQLTTPLSQYAPARALGAETKTVERIPDASLAGLPSGATKTLAKGYAETGKFLIDVPKLTARGLAERLDLTGFSDNPNRVQRTATKLANNLSNFSNY